MNTEEKVDKEVEELLEKYPKALDVYYSISKNKKWRLLAEASNKVAVDRLGYNDHGPVHLKITAKNSSKIAILINKSEITFSSQEEFGFGFEDVLSIIVAGSMLHDIGISINRINHEITSTFLANLLLDELLSGIYEEETIYKMRGYILECIFCHMGNIPASSLEAKVVSIGDGLDMEEGRARLPFYHGKEDIHKFSALAIDKINITYGDEKPVKIEVLMKDLVGVFQIEELLLKKIKAAKMEDFLELYAVVLGEKVIRYL